MRTFGYQKRYDRGPRVNLAVLGTRRNQDRIRDLEGYISNRRKAGMPVDHLEAELKRLRNP